MSDYKRTVENNLSTLQEVEYYLDDINSTYLDYDTEDQIGEATYHVRQAMDLLEDEQLLLETDWRPASRWAEDIVMYMEQIADALCDAGIVRRLDTETIEPTRTGSLPGALQSYVTFYNTYRRDAGRLEQSLNELESES